MLCDVDDKLYYHRPRHDSDEPSTTSGPAPSGSGATPPPSSTNNTPLFTSSPVFSSRSLGNNVSSTLVLTTMIPVTTIRQQNTTYTSFSQSLVTPASSTPPQAASGTSPNTSTIGTRYTPICAGQGVDSAAAGILASIILPSVVGLILWVRELANG